MKWLLTFFVSLSLGGTVLATDLFKNEIKDIGNKTIDWKSYQGKPLLLVNIATRCGYTPQLKGLEQVYQKYQKQGLMVLGIPSNDFGEQTPEENKDVKKFCLLNYGVSFPLTEKIVVKGAKKHPFVADLLQASSDHGEIAWNFEKFLISKDRKSIERFKSKVKPEDPQFLKAIEAAL
ncbi:MAG: glutathione peroxidase [Bdellovibrionales bacterium]|nr:glutathione peroxidase [Bdellovibrionales bacterium]